MHFLNITVKMEKGKIIVRLDESDCDSFRPDPLLVNLLGDERGITAILQKRYRYSEKEVDELFAPAKPSYTNFTADVPDSRHNRTKRATFEIESRTFTLPADNVTAVFDFLAALQNFVDEDNFKAESIAIDASGKSILDLLETRPQAKTSGTRLAPQPQDETQRLSPAMQRHSGYVPSRHFRGSMSQYIASFPPIKPEHPVAMHIIAQLLAALKDVNPSDPYAALKQSLTTLLAYQASHQLQVMQCLVDSCMEIMTGVQIDRDLLNPQLSEQEKLQNIKKIRSILDADQRDGEFGLIMKKVHLRAVERLYAPCLNQPSLAGGANKYNWGCSEWLFLRDAKFVVRNDGRIGIKVQDNPAYQRFYVDNQLNHNIFEKEMRHLGFKIGLEFADDVDFHSEIIFTPECSRRLMAHGLHLDADSLTKLEKPMLRATYSLMTIKGDQIDNKRTFEFTNKKDLEVKFSELKNKYHAVENKDGETHASMLSAQGIFRSATGRCKHGKLVELSTAEVTDKQRSLTISGK